LFSTDLFRWPLLRGCRCRCVKLQPFSLCWENFEELSVAIYKCFHNYLTSISQALTSSFKLSQAIIYRLELSVWVTPQTERVIVLSKILRVLHCCPSLAANMGTTIEQYRSRIGCHNNFVKAKDVSSRVRGRFWNTILMMFYLNVFYLPI